MANIVIVDDETQVRRTLKRVLGKHYGNIKTAATADEAWDIIGRDTDLVLLDIMMPGMDPKDFIERTRRHQMDNIKIIYVSALPFNEEEIVELIDGEKVIGFIKKPFDNEYLINKVREAVGE